MIFFLRIFEKNKGGKEKGLMQDIKEKLPTNFWINGVYIDASSDIFFSNTKMHIRIKVLRKGEVFQFGMRDD